MTASMIIFLGTSEYFFWVAVIFAALAAIQFPLIENEHLVSECLSIRYFFLVQYLLNTIFIKIEKQTLIINE